MSTAGRPAFTALMAHLQFGTQDLFAQGAPHRLTLGLELMWKLEEQVVLPALHDAAPHLSHSIAHLDRELGVLRDLAALLSRAARAERGLAVAVLEGLTMLHFARLEELLESDGLDAVAWPALEAEAHDLLLRWRSEIESAGEIEDEDRDPVGLPPR